MYYCSEACKSLHWTRTHKEVCKTSEAWCPACEVSILDCDDSKVACSRCQTVTYCSQRCLHQDFAHHVAICPVRPRGPDGRPRERQDRAQLEWSSVPTLMQPVEELSQTAILVDDSGVQDRVQAARRQHSIVSAQLPEEEQEDSRRCEDARDEVIQWIAENKPQTTAEERRVTEHMARVATKLLSELGHMDQTCTREG